MSLAFSTEPLLWPRRGGQTTAVTPYSLNYDQLRVVLPKSRVQQGVSGGA
jgi:hypothetical protein